MIISQLTLAVIIMYLLDQTLKFMMRYRFYCILFVQLKLILITEGIHEYILLVKFKTLQ